MKRLTIVAIAAMLGLMAPSLSADTWNQLTYMTFSGPVEIPGQVLPAGKYVFRLLDAPSDRNIVQIFNADQSKLFATILAIPDYRLKPTDKTVITFEERAANAPPAIRAWFYPGDNYGQEFVYPKARAVQLAEVTKLPVPAMPETLTPSTKAQIKSPAQTEAQALKKAPLKAEQPSGGEVEVAQAFQAPPQQAQAAPAAPARPAETELPKTASPLPWFALGGLVLASGGFLTRLAARRSN
jgi:LPXTG-motif cell wall-anchored protein